MRIILTDNVRNHKFNDSYKCVVVKFEPSVDAHFSVERLDWLPKDDEILALTRALFVYSPSFRRELERWFHGH